MYNIDIDYIQEQLQQARDLNDHHAYIDGYTDAREWHSPQSNQLAYMDGYRAGKAEMQRFYCCECSSNLATLDYEW